MGDIIGALPQLAALIEKGGVIGLLLLVAGVLGSEVWRLRKALGIAISQRDKFRIGYAVCKAECDRAGLHPDLSLVAELEALP